MSVVATGRRPTPATEPQRRHVRRLLGGYVRGYAWAFGTPVFPRPELAKCYALARHAPRPRTKREASDLIGVLERDRKRFEKESRGKLTEEERREPYAIVELANRPENREWRRRAQLPLARGFGFPNEGWLDRLNTAINAGVEAQGVGAQKELERFDHLFRARVVDPLFGAGPGEGRGV